MRFRRFISDMNSQLLNLNIKEKRSLFAVAVVMFSLLLSYPLVRSVSTAVFLEAFGAKNSPYVWMISIVILTASVFLYNKFQARFNIQRLFLITVFITIFVLNISYWGMSVHSSYWAYPLYVWKEVYIVLLIHSCLAYLNSIINENLAKIIYGPLGALGSLGGICGGLLTGKLTQYLDLGQVLWVASFIILLSVSFFWFTDRSQNITKDNNKGEKTPIESIKGVSRYVLLIAMIVMVSQFVISLANFQFNTYLTSELPGKVEKTHFLGNFYTLVNSFSLGIQFFVIPFIFRIFSQKSIHFCIPSTYLIVFLLGMVISGGALLPSAFAFGVYKGLDYSLFSGAKELLYFSLTRRQKYGAKYIVDMISYRFGKGLISLILVFIQSAVYVKSLLIGFLILWICLLVPLFKMYNSIRNGDQTDESSSS